MPRADQAILKERLDSRGIRGEIRVYLARDGRYVTEYKLGTLKMPLEVSGRTAIEALESAKKWLTTSMGSR